MVNRRNVLKYDQYEIERLKGIQLPVKIKCGRCHKNFPQAKYSTKQLNELRYQISQGVQNLKPINCQPCTGPQIVELECTMCHKTKGLEDFAKSQRSKPDTARCFKCTEILVTQEPVNHDRYEDPNKTFVTPDSFCGYVPDYWSSASSTMGSSTIDDHDWSTLDKSTSGNTEGGGVALSGEFRRAMSISGSVPETLIGFEYSCPVGSGNGYPNEDGWSEVQTRSWHSESIGASASTNSGFHGNRHGHYSSTSHAGTQRTYTSSIAERSDEAEVRPNGWAKIKAYKAPSPTSQVTSSMAFKAPVGPSDTTRSPFVRPSGDTRREIEDAWAGSDEEEEEEDDASDDSDGDNTVI